MLMLREVTTEFVVCPPPHVPVHHQVALPGIRCIVLSLPPSNFKNFHVRPGERAERCAPGLGDVLVPKCGGLAGGDIVPLYEEMTMTPRHHPLLAGPINCRYLDPVMRPWGIPRHGGRRGVSIPPRASSSLQHFQEERIVTAIPVLLHVNAERVLQSGGGTR